MKSLLVMSLLLVSLNSMAYSETEQLYVTYCGSKADLTAYATSQGHKLTKADLAEANEMRQPVLSVLKNGKAALEEIKKSDNGQMAAVMVCGIVNLISKEIKENGCVDLSANKIVGDNGGLAACSKIK